MQNILFCLACWFCYLKSNRTLSFLRRTSHICNKNIAATQRCTKLRAEFTFSTALNEAGDGLSPRRTFRTVLHPCFKIQIITFTSFDLQWFPFSWLPVPGQWWWHAARGGSSLSSPQHLPGVSRLSPHSPRTPLPHGTCSMGVKSDLIRDKLMTGNWLFFVSHFCNVTAHE